MDVDEDATASTSPVLWTISIQSMHCMRMIVHTVATTLQLATFQVKRTDDGSNRWVLWADVADLALTSCASARLFLEEEHVSITNGDEISFCLDTKLLETSIESSAPHSAVRIVGGGDVVRIQIVELDDDAVGDCVSDEVVLRTLVDCETPTEIQPFDVATTIQMDVCSLRELLKKARKYHAETLRLRVSYFTNGGSVACALTELVTTGDADVYKRYASAVRTEEDGSRIVDTADDDKRLTSRSKPEHVYDAQFPIERVDSFVRAISTRKISAFVNKDMPLMFEASLGDDVGHVRFLVAPIQESCD